MDYQAIMDAEDSAFPEDRTALISLVKTSVSHAMKMSDKAIALMEERGTKSEEHLELVKQNTSLAQLSRQLSQAYRGVLQDKVGVGLGCFVGGFLLGVTLSIEPSWLMKR